MTDLPPPLMNITKAAKALGVDRKTVYRWIFAGDLRITRLAGRPYVAHAEVERVLRAKGEKS